MKLLPLIAASLLLNSFAHADLVDSCALTNKTACILNKPTYEAQFVMMLPNYAYCGVRFLSDTYPTASVLANFQAGLYVTAGPRWDMIAEQSGYVNGVLIYPVGSTPMYMTFFNVYTRNGQSLNDYIHEKLATSYNSNPTVTLIAMPCASTPAAPPSR